jgi:Spy/CpxP family protein refolding chaperone
MRFATRVAVTAGLVAGLGGLSVLAQPPGGGRGMMFGGGPAQLVNSKTVQKELKVTDEQATKLKEWAKEFGAKQREKMQALFQGGGFDREKFAEAQAEMLKEAHKELGTILKEDQVKRLQQIEVQMAGSMALVTNPEVKDALKLTEEQQDKIREVQKASFQERRDLAEEYGVKGFGARPQDPDKAKEYDKKLAAIDKDMTDKALAVLTDDQKKKYKELTGEPVDVAAIRRESMPAGGGFGKKKKKDD